MSDFVGTGDQLDVQVSIAEVDLTTPDDDWLRSGNLTRDLKILGAPEKLRSRVAGLIGDRSLVVTESLAAKEALGHFFREGEWGDIISRSRIDKAVPVVAAASPNAVDAKSTGTFTFTKSRGGGLSLKLGGMGLSAKVKYTISQGISVECEVAEAKIANLLVPLDMVRQEYRPPGAREWFNVVHYEPIPDAPLGKGAIGTSGDDLLDFGTEPVAPLRGDVSFSGSEKRDLDVEFSFDLGLDDDSLSLSAELSGTVSIGFDYELPAGDFDMYWLRGPAGACIMLPR